ncbi:glycine--tRNA ligase [archaeon]|nr:MAG: glycine--tRNA ligase [archaeon]
MDELVNLCKKKGFIFQSSEIYSPMAGFYDYGPLGVELKNNIKKAWWKEMVQKREDIVGLDSSIISSPEIWKASGHVAGFSDPMVDCKETKQRFRADQVFWAALETIDGKVLGYITLIESEAMGSQAKKDAAKKVKALGHTEELKPLVLKDLTEAPQKIYHLLPSPATGKEGQLTPPRDFNLMFQTSVGAMSDAASVAYLRPETAQGIFTNFLSVQRAARTKVPFGIAQIGKAFRNEITPRNFIFRSREFEQMEIEYFIPPQDEVWPKFHADWINTCWAWLKSVGLREELMHESVHSKDKLAHYARACTDIVFDFPFGRQELMGVAARGNFDLTQHMTHSGKAMTYLDPITNEKYVPHCIEPSIGVDRLFLALLVSAYREEVVDGEKRVVLGFTNAMAPIKVSVLPLVSNKPELVAKAREVFSTLQNRYQVEFDISGAIGRRYRRADESGTPFCITIDFDTLQDNTVTVRQRDSMQQLRMSINEAYAYLSKEIDGF